jgi:hypothetical protein
LDYQSFTGQEAGLLYSVGSLARVPDRQDDPIPFSFSEETSNSFYLQSLPSYDILGVPHGADPVKQAPRRD